MLDETSPARLPRLAPALIGALALAFGIAACGDDDEDSGDGEEAASAEEVTVVATEYEFDLSATPTAETKEVTLDNQGEEQHALIFARINEGFTLDEVIELEGQEGSADIVGEAFVKPGDSKAIEVKKSLKPGAYAMLCPIGSKEGPHYELGQLEEFDIG